MERHYNVHYNFPGTLDGNTVSEMQCQPCQKNVMKLTKPVMRTIEFDMLGAKENHASNMVVSSVLVGAKGIQTSNN